MKSLVLTLLLALGWALQAGAQQPAAPNPPAPQPPRAGPPAGGFGQRGPRFDPASVERGQQLFVAQCGFCHGSNARGAQGPDLIRSPLVLNDENGRQLAEYLKVGAPEKGMPKFALPEQQTTDIATFLHRQIEAVSNRGAYKILDILVGDADAGEAYFNGAGRCHACHSPAGDLKGIGDKYDPVTLQGRIVMPRGRGGFGGGRGRFGTPEAASTQPTVTVTLPSGQVYSGRPVRITDFDVMLRDASGVLRSFARNGDTPKVETKDPLQPHIDMLAAWKDSDIHNMTAYLVTLK